MLLFDPNDSSDGSGSTWLLGPPLQCLPVDPLASLFSTSFKLYPGLSQGASTGKRKGLKTTTSDRVSEYPGFT